MQNLIVYVAVIANDKSGVLIFSYYTTLYQLLRLCKVE
jgi:hypothetical protein